MAVMSSASATHQPMRKPVMMYVFEKVSTTMDWSFMPSMYEMLSCLLGS